MTRTDTRQDGNKKQQHGESTCQSRRRGLTTQGNALIDDGLGAAHSIAQQNVLAGFRPRLLLNAFLPTPTDTKPDGEIR